LLLKSRIAWARKLSVALVLYLAAGVAQAQFRRPIQLQKLVVVGDSLAAGVENGSLADFQQIHGFGAVIARHMYTRLTLPLVPYPGAPNTLELVNPNFPPVIQPVPGALPFPRLNPMEQVTNVAVPLQTVADALNRRPDNNLNSTDLIQAATNLVLGFPCPVLYACSGLPQTQVEEAVAQHPTIIVVQIGSNDILQAIRNIKDLADPTRLAAFYADFNSNYAKLLDALAATKAKIVVGNVVDVMESAYFVRVPALAAAANIPLDQVTALLGVDADDRLPLEAIPTVEEILTNARPGPLPAACGGAPCVVTAFEADLARQGIRQLNTIIELQTTLHGAAPVDLFSVFDSIYKNGYQVQNVTLTADFLGGLFSLDGLHPSNTGYAIMANEFIKGINSALGTTYRLANVAAIARHDPLVLNRPQ
jgi:lysophospholipase L1-like esterase